MTQQTEILFFLPRYYPSAIPQSLFLTSLPSHPDSPKYLSTIFSPLNKFSLPFLNLLLFTLRLLEQSTLTSGILKMFLFLHLLPFKTYWGLLLRVIFLRYCFYYISKLTIVYWKLSRFLCGTPVTAIKLPSSPFQV